MEVQDIFSLKNKVALISGGSKGIGAMIAEGFVAAGCRVYIVARDPVACASTAARLDGGVGECYSLPGDVSSSAGIARIVSDFGSKESSLNILVNNAGTTFAAPLSKHTEEKWDDIFDINLKSVFYMTQQFLPLLQASGSRAEPARIINTSSYTARRPGRSGDYAYRASKAGVNQLTQMLANELGDLHILVNAIAPGYFPTDMSAPIIGSAEAERRFLEKLPARQGGKPENIAGIALYLASASGSFITGDIVTVDGGHSLIA